jgi:hypothetical protein
LLAAGNDLCSENEAIERPLYLGNLALAYALTGETEKAVGRSCGTVAHYASAGRNHAHPVAELEVGYPAKQSAFPENSAGAGAEDSLLGV